MSSILHDSIIHGLYDRNIIGNEQLTPKLLTNVEEPIWFNIKRHLLTCTSFTWAVAFLTEDMLTPFKLVMEDLDKKDVSGTIITSDYLNFNSPKVFKELLKIPNLQVKICQKDGFHAKGYLFDHRDHQSLIVGSNNFTRAALLQNTEWAMEFTSSTNSALTKQISDQIKFLREDSIGLTLDWIDQYTSNWQPIKRNDSHFKKITKRITPNNMQASALMELDRLIKKGQKKGLVVSATGTGKTYLGAFAVRNFQPKRFLYIVHRKQIAQKSLNSFQNVLQANPNDYGLLSGNQQDFDKKYLFATVQTLSQDSVLNQLDPAYFDYILIDEAHRVGAPSYKKILSHFKPNFWLGLTATPERMDQQDIYETFDFNLAYEIRLKAALENKMLTPFHYIGVEDYIVDGESIDETSALSKLTNEERVDYILKELDYYGYCGKVPKGLVFCSRREEAIKLAQLFSSRGYLSKALTNEDSESTRQKVVKELEEGKINYIFSVDLFNEGIDIPALNQIVMLRNTQSSIVFIQQLGRGLRKFPGKEFVTVIDFIGNYKNNYLIPLSLFDDRSKSKDRARQDVKVPELLGVSTINFSEIASEKILSSIENTKLDSMKDLRSSYFELRKKMGRVPFLTDFEKFGSTAPEVFINNQNLKHYGNFLQKMGETVELTTYQNSVLNFVTKELSNGKRPHELILLDLLLHNSTVTKENYLNELKKYGAYYTKEVQDSVENILNLDFFDVKVGKTTRKIQYGNSSLIDTNLFGYSLNPKIRSALKSDSFLELFVDAINVGLVLNKKYNSSEQFTLYQQYNREDVCRLLNWPLDVSAPMYGYRVSEQETPIFITYKKDSDKKRNSIYQNNLEDGQSLRWYTRSPRHIDSVEVQRLLDKNMKLHVFVKQSDQVGKEFFYLGQANIEENSVKEELIGPKKKAVVGMNLKLQQQLSAKMYDLLFNEH